jgi:CRP/FNR family transcriptional regulator
MIGEQSNDSCFACPRKHLTDWNDLKPSELEIVDRYKRDRILLPGQVLYHQGDACEGIYSIKKGLIGERRIDAEGNSTLVRLCHPGTTIAYQEMLSRTAHRNSAEALLESHICYISKSVVRQLLAVSPKLGERYLRRSIQDAKELEDALVDARTTTVKTRFLQTLMVMYERSGSYEPQIGHVCEIPITRRDIAALIGTAPETISRTIRDLEKDNMVYFQGRKAVIPDLDVVFSEFY